VEGGIAGKIEQVGAPVGTTVRVEDLFYNVPARLKFLKQDMTERRTIDGFLARYALAYPQVRFRLTDGSAPHCKPPATATAARSWPRFTVWTWPNKCSKCCPMKMVSN